MNRIPRTAINVIIALGFAPCSYFAHCTRPCTSCNEQNNCIFRNPIAVYNYIINVKQSLISKINAL